VLSYRSQSPLLTSLPALPPYTISRLILCFTVLAVKRAPLHNLRINRSPCFCLVSTLRRDVTALRAVLKTPFCVQFYGSPFTAQTEDGDGNEDSVLWCRKCHCSDSSGGKYSSLLTVTCVDVRFRVLLLLHQ
jgi:hypothetical protein